MGAVILRRNPRHVEECADRIRRRLHPAWSQFDCSYRVTDIQKDKPNDH